ncbi:MAG TPA: nickel pincer cofactor biosynthesis protein LarC, partial [Verrucomicrobiae bacterium]|nr:nickel pincer cofactor biosynthesis protein LarC [Verrucomicrobiae bacterium]
HTHEHEHHEHAHSHSAEHGRSHADIVKLINASALSEWVKAKSLAVFQRVAVAEGKIHGKPPADVHFHEVGAIDSIVDIVGACIALEILSRPRVLSSNVVEGHGWLNCAHGRFPVPAPATLEILAARAVPIAQCDEPAELVTPTGAALLAEFVEKFGPMDSFVPQRVGFGIGKRNNKTRPNVLRAILGETSATVTHDWETDTVAVLETNLDDINPELLGNFVDLAMSAGALDVSYAPMQMKKNRPGVLLSILCPPEQADKFCEMILRQTSAFGVRRSIAERRKLRREFVTAHTPYGDVTVKIGKLDGAIVQIAPEFESCKKLALEKNAPLKTVYDAARKAAT